MNNVYKLGNTFNFGVPTALDGVERNPQNYLEVFTTPTMVDGQVYVRDKHNPDHHMAIIGVGNKITQHAQYFTQVRDKIDNTLSLGKPDIKSYTSRGGLWHMEEYTFNEVSDVVHSLYGGKTELKLQLLALRSVDGRTANTLITSVMSGWCFNKQLFGVSDDSQKFKAKNTKNFNLPLFVDGGFNASIVFSKFVQEQQRLALLKMSETTRKQVIEAMIPESRINGRMIALANDNAEYWGDSAYSVVNALTNYASYADDRNGFTLNKTKDGLDNSAERLYDRRFKVEQWLNSKAWQDAIAVAA